MTTKLRLAQACFFLTLAPLTAAAQAQDAECHSNESFAVAVKAYDDEPGARFAVRALEGNAAPAECVFDEVAADVVIGKPGDPLWFGELAGDFLIATRSTGPQGDLVVFELPSGRTVLDVPADDYIVDDGQVSFWQRVSEGDEENCPTFVENEENGLGSAIVRHGFFDLGLGKVAMTDETRCDATQ